MSDFIISGFQEPVSLPSPLAVRHAELLQIAWLELCRFEYGMLDLQSGKSSQAARELTELGRRTGRLSHPEARQRTAAYTPAEGHEHCPRCWVREDLRAPLAFESRGTVDVASCGGCGAQFQLALG
ncbi:MAG: hypothetical protein KA795_17970 [Burkholderiaceae bacterium]|nr:hypothetical protein [Burkholderiaceae bacterium]